MHAVNNNIVFTPLLGPKFGEYSERALGPSIRNRALVVLRLHHELIQFEFLSVHATGNNIDDTGSSVMPCHKGEQKLCEFPRG